MKIKEQIIKATKIVRANSYRPKADDGSPGGLLDLSRLNHKPFIVGDLHGSLENIQAIVKHEGNDKALEKDKAVLIILGDAVHNDQTGHMKEMESSLLTLEYIIELICKYKENVIYIRGNHDTFDDRLRKSGIAQGLEMRNYFLEERDEEYVELIEEFFEALPVFIIGKGYVITHAGPIRGGATRNELINIHEDPSKYSQLLWNRLHEFRGTPSLKEYDGKDIERSLEKLKLPPNTPFIVGHNPMWHTGNKTGVWKDILGIKNHYILYTNIATRAPYLTMEGGELVTKFALEPKKVEVSYDR